MSDADGSIVLPVIQKGGESKRGKESSWARRALSICAMSVLLPLMASCSGAVTAAPAGPGTSASSSAPPSSTANPTEKPENASPDSPSPRTTTAAPANTASAGWVEYVRSRTSTVARETDDEVISTAKKMCDRMKDGELFEEEAYDIAAKGLPKAYQSDMQLILGTGTVEFCPEFMGPSDLSVVEGPAGVALQG